MNLSSIPENSTCHILGLGDLMFAGNISNHVSAHPEFNPFGPISSILEKGDLIIANLETPLTDKGVYSKGSASSNPRFMAAPVFAERLAKAGIRIVSLANNHILDQGQDGLHDTINHLELAGVTPIGIIKNESAEQKPAIVDVHGIRIGFLAYGIGALAGSDTMGVAHWDSRRLRHEISSLKKRTSFVVVCIHVGNEYTPYPSIRAWRVMSLARRFGADVIFGHHPHVPQGFRFKNLQATYYSLGNFVSDMHNPALFKTSIARARKEGNPFLKTSEQMNRVSKSMIASVTIGRRGVESATSIICSIDPQGRPEVCKSSDLFNISVSPPFHRILVSELYFQAMRLKCNPTERIHYFFQKYWIKRQMDRQQY